MLREPLVHLIRRCILEPLPAIVLVGEFLVILAFWKDAPLHRLSKPGGFALLEFLHLVQALEEEQVGDLFYDFDRIGNASRPEGVPDAVDLIANFAGKHIASIC